MTKTTTGPSDENGNGIQAIGHQVGSLASVTVVAMVEFGVPLTPGQQSSILSMIAVGWALFSSIYGIRHSTARRATGGSATARRPTTRRRERPTNDNPAGATPNA